MAKQYNFVIVRTILAEDGNIAVRDILGVSPTLEGARVYAQKLLKARTGQDLFFQPSGWGRMELYYYGETGALNTISIAPINRVTQATQVV